MIPAMGATWAICRRDLISFFTTPLAWLVLFAWTMLTNMIFHFASLEPATQFASNAPLSVTTLQMGSFLLILLAPALSMNSFANERNQGTMQLLLTVPIREIHLVLGKFAAVFVMLCCLVGTTLAQVLVLYFISDVGTWQTLSGYIGLVLLCGMLAALGTWISLLVESPVAAYVITFGVIAILHLFGFLAQTDGTLALVGNAIGIGPRYEGFVLGHVQAGDVMYFVAATAIFLACEHVSICSKRIQG